ncbi:MAG: AIPR family protein [Oceanobacter sp.]
MNINASIVDQRLDGLVRDHAEWLPAGQDPTRQKSTAFVLLCTATFLGLSLEETSELITEGGQDAGVDAIYINDPEDGEFQVTIFQGKYKHKDLSGTANFPARGIESGLMLLGTLFDPSRQVAMNPRLKPKIEEVRSLIQDGYIPSVRLVLCNNGARWNADAQLLIDQSDYPADQVSWLHCNHNQIVQVLQKQKSVNDALRLKGKAVIEDFDFRRVLVGKIALTEVAGLMNRHGDNLLERNVRRYLGLHRSRVNSAIHDTLKDDQKRDDFYFFNNGITMICRKFRHNALQGEDYQLRLEDIQIINGGQTCKTIQQALANNPELNLNQSFVLLRLYELADDDQAFVQDITYATNSQNPVDLRDLKANDPIQAQLELGIQELGYAYRRKREEFVTESQEFTSATVAESVLAIWRHSPHQAKFQRKEHFGKLYRTTFESLNASQAVLAALIFRKVENERKRPSIQPEPAFLPYASHYIAMMVGELLLQDTGLNQTEITHKHFAELKQQLEDNSAQYQQQAYQHIQEALDRLYGRQQVSLQQLSATFRRGDLLLHLFL